MRRGLSHLWPVALLFMTSFSCAQELDTFTVPIMKAADPWVVRHEGKYYWAFSEQGRGLRIHCSTRLSEPGAGTVVWQAPVDGPYSRQVWAPEIHFLDGRAWIYFAASDGLNANHRMFAVRASSNDPLGSYEFAGELYTGDDVSTGTNNRWAIDGTVLEHQGKRYFIWSGWEDENDVQYLYIARLDAPGKIGSNRVRLCQNDDHLWERVAENPAERGLNEAPQVLIRDERIFLIYSASASWLPTYKLGLLELDPAGDPLDPSAWRKADTPVFQSTAKTFGVGHDSFTLSPDGTEWWHVYHAKTSREPGFDRVIIIQPFTWTADGRPDFGLPLDPGTTLKRPSGETP